MIMGDFEKRTLENNVIAEEYTPALLSFLFWNIQGNELSSTIYDLVVDNNYPEILIFSETTQKSRSKIELLLLPLGYISRTQLKGKVRVAIFDKLTKIKVLCLREDQRFTSIIYQINEDNIMLTGVHLDSPIAYPDSNDRYVRAVDHFRLIENTEQLYDVKKTILIGDFNMNPYDKGMASEFSFKATHCKRTAQNSLVHKRYFFNPSWTVFGNDLTVSDGKPPGTIYYQPRNKETYVDFWHVFDQVLIRSDLFSDYTYSFEVITRTSKVRLLNEELIPDKRRFSDHLPIKYSIKI